MTKIFFFQPKLSHCALANLLKGVQSNDANCSSMLQSFALFDNPKFPTLLLIYYAHFHGRSALGLQPFCKIKLNVTIV